MHSFAHSIKMPRGNLDSTLEIQAAAMWCSLHKTCRNVSPQLFFTIRTFFARVRSTLWFTILDSWSFWIMTPIQPMWKSARCCCLFAFIALQTPEELFNDLPIWELLPLHSWVESGISDAVMTCCIVSWTDVSITHLAATRKGVSPFRSCCDRTSTALSPFVREFNTLVNTFSP